jgi:hypothetical protein
MNTEMFPVGGSLMTEQDPALTESPREQNAESVTPFAAHGKSVAWRVVLAVALFIATGAFATLWTVERRDHQTTSGQLGDAQAEFRQVQLNLVPGLEAEAEKDRPSSNTVPRRQEIPRDK